MPIPESIEKNVLELDEQDRIHLLLKLLESLERAKEENDQVENWVNEADMRYKAWKSGEMKTIPEDEVFRKLRQNSDDDR